MTRLVVLAVVAVISAMLVASLSWTRPGPASPERGELQVPFSGPGTLLTIWQAGDKGTPPERALVLTREGASRAMAGIEPRRARWRSASELLVEEYVDSSERLLRLSIDGKVLEVLSEGESLSDVEPSPDGRWAALERSDTRARVGLELRDLERGFSLHGLRSRDSDPRFGTISQAVWSPDGEYLALAVQRREEVGLVPRLAVLPRDGGPMVEVPDATGTPERGGVVPLFWTRDGIYARSSRGLLRCDPQGAGCTLVYAPGKARFAFAGALSGEAKALLLVQDHDLDPLEVRAKEIHEVDLASGTARLLLRLPANLFITDIDWVGDASGHP